MALGRRAKLKPRPRDKRCVDCGETKPLSEFYTRKTPTGIYPQSQCKPCLRVRTLDWKKRNPGPRTKPTGHRAHQKFVTKIRREYGLFWEDYAAMVLVQEGRCAICESATPKLVIDHCHTTNVVRGLLCSNCNCAIGLLADNVERMLEAAAYVHYHL